MAGFAEIQELLDASPRARRDLVGFRRLLMPASVIAGLIGLAATTSWLGEVTVVAASLPVLLLAAWSCGPRWTLWFALVAAVAPAFTQPWNPIDTATGMVARLLIYLTAGILVAVLRVSLDRAIEIAERDRMTGLLNRAGFVRKLTSEGNRARRAGWPVAVGFLDCDNFKQVNDTQGHLEGDRVLKRVARTIDDNIRNYDSAARFGGDEFVILWPVLSSKGGEDAARRLHRILTAACDKESWRVGFSLGVAVFEVIPDADEMLGFADRLMYDVKRTGKGAVNVAIYDQAEHERRSESQTKVGNRATDK